MAFDLEALLAPLDGDAPAGPDRTYSNERQQIEEAFVETEDSGASYVGGELVANEASTAGGPDWKKTTALILGEAAQARDLWLGVYLARAGARGGDLATLANGLALTQGWLERWWETGWPSLEEDGPVARVMACASLAQGTAFLKPLNGVVMFSHPRFGPFTGADFIRFGAEGGSSEEGYGLFRGALEETGVDELAALKARLVGVKTTLITIEKTLDDKTEGDGARLADAVQAVDGLIHALAVFTEDAEPAATEETGAGGSAGGARGPSGPGVIAGRADVIRSLDAICEFYRKNEPSSPIPMVLKRARAWVELDFLEILQDIAPAGASEAKGILSTRE